MKYIYQPRGAAREYAPWALNMWTGCSHGCLYCYCPGAARKSRDAWLAEVHPRKDVVKIVTRDAAQMAEKIGCGEIEDGEILLSFMSDPYHCPRAASLTAEVLDILIFNGLHGTILTKGGMTATRDFSMLYSGQWRFGQTIVFSDQALADHWEPNAATVDERMCAFEEAKSVGIKTWLSLEPVIEPEQALEVVRKCRHYVDAIKVGKINHWPEIEAAVGDAGWREFVVQLEALCAGWDIDLTLKQSLQPYAR